MYQTPLGAHLIINLQRDRTQNNKIIMLGFHLEMIHMLKKKLEAKNLTDEDRNELLNLLLMLYDKVRHFWLSTWLFFL